jgi:hypothetical protein
VELVLVFAAGGLAVYVLGLRAQEYSKSFTATATVCRPIDGADAKTVQRRILSDDNLHQAITRLGLPTDARAGEPSGRIERLREHLHVSTKESPDSGQMRIAITCRDFPEGEPAVRLVNDLAGHCARAYRRSVEATAARAHHDTRQAADRARVELVEAKTRFDALLDRHFKELHNRVDQLATHVVPPRAPSRAAAGQPYPVGSQWVENPEWTDIHRQLTSLRQRRAELIEQRTAAHPIVRDTDFRIAEVEQRLASIPRQVRSARSELPVIRPAPGGPPASVQTLPPAEAPREPARIFPAETAQQYTETVRLFLLHRDALADARRTYDRLARLERETWQARHDTARIDVALAGPCASWTRPAHSPRLLLMALALGLTGAVGVGMISNGAAAEPTFATAAEVEAALSAPIVGTVPATDPPESKAKSQYLPSTDRLVLIACGGLLILLTAGVVLAMLGGFPLS